MEVSYILQFGDDVEKNFLNSASLYVDSLKFILKPAKIFGHKILILAGSFVGFLILVLLQRTIVHHLN